MITTLMEYLGGGIGVLLMFGLGYGLGHTDGNRQRSDGASTKRVSVVVGYQENVYVPSKDDEVLTMRSVGRW